MPGLSHWAAPSFAAPWLPVIAAAQPRLQGTFLSLNAAGRVGGMIIGRDAQGHLTHDRVAGMPGSLPSLASLWLVSQVRVHGTTTSPR